MLSISILGIGMLALDWVGEQNSTFKQIKTQCQMMTLGREVVLLITCHIKQKQLIAIAIGLHFHSDKTVLFKW